MVRMRHSDTEYRLHRGQRDWLHVRIHDGPGLQPVATGADDRPVPAAMGQGTQLADRAPRRRRAQVTAQGRDDSRHRPQERGLCNRRDREVATGHGRQLPSLGPRIRLLLRNAVWLEVCGPDLEQRQDRAGPRRPGRARRGRALPRSSPWQRPRADGRVPDRSAGARGRQLCRPP